MHFLTCSMLRIIISIEIKRPDLTLVLALFLKGGLTSPHLIKVQSSIQFKRIFKRLEIIR